MIVAMLLCGGGTPLVSNVGTMMLGKGENISVEVKAGVWCEGKSAAF